MCFKGNFIDNKIIFVLDILAINSANFYNVNRISAYLINPRGGYEQLDLKFEDDTEVYRSCSLQWQNQYYLFGGNGVFNGSDYKRQVSMVSGYRLERKSTLDFNFKEGACTVINHQTILLCFALDETDVCRQSNNPLGSFTQLPYSKFHHKMIRIASFDGKKTSY